MADDRTPMRVDTVADRDSTLNVVWLLRSEVDEIMKYFLHTIHGALC